MLPLHRQPNLVNLRHSGHVLNKTINVRSVLVAIYRKRRKLVKHKWATLSQSVMFQISCMFESVSLPEADGSWPQLTLYTGHPERKTCQHVFWRGFFRRTDAETYCPRLLYSGQCLSGETRETGNRKNPKQAVRKLFFYYINLCIRLIFFL